MVENLAESNLGMRFSKGGVLFHIQWKLHGKIMHVADNYKKGSPAMVWGISRGHCHWVPSCGKFTDPTLRASEVLNVLYVYQL